MARETRELWVEVVIGSCGIPFLTSDIFLVVYHRYIVGMFLLVHINVNLIFSYLSKSENNELLFVSTEIFKIKE